MWGKHGTYYIISITQVCVGLQDLEQHIELSCLWLGDFVLAFLYFVSCNAYTKKINESFFKDLGVSTACVIKNEVVFMLMGWDSISHLQCLPPCLRVSSLWTSQCEISPGVLQCSLCFCRLECKNLTPCNLWPFPSSPLYHLSQLS